MTDVFSNARVQRLRPPAPESVEPAPLRQDDIAALERAAHPDPFSVLGPRLEQGRKVVRAYLPGALGVELVGRDDVGPPRPMVQRQADGLFVATLERDAPYRLRIAWPGATVETEDPYSFDLCLSDFDLHLLREGRHFRLSDCLGARCVERDGVAGVIFAVWAPNARAVSVVGDFNAWDARRHPMRLRHDAGVWELFAPRLAAGERYKFALIGPDGSRLPLKADPVAAQAEKAPGTASVVAAPLTHEWTDADWMATRGARHAPTAPISIYEVHLGSWLKPSGQEPTWDTARTRLLPYVKAVGFTHIELLPVAEHPFNGSWGYQPLGLFAPTARFGEPEGFARFVDACHQAGVGVIVDWVPAHFPSDQHGLARFDGTALYEHEDPREGYHPDWKTLVYNFGRRETRGFLTASALRWLEDFHVDGLRVDAVASMLYRDYSRREGEWTPNRHGGRENLEAVDFLRHVNETVAARCPGAMMIAEESTSWPGVTAPVEKGGLGFQYKWNMGWMNDTLRYIARDPAHRRWHHDEITFGLCYAFSERFMLPLSHDEVVHGKRSLLAKAPGDDWRKRATLRALLAQMWAHPGKKLLFMGAEFGQWREWNHDGDLDWALIDDPAHAGILGLTRDLNRLYRDEPALHGADSRSDGFRWLIADDRDNSVFAFLRLSGGALPIVFVVNFTPEIRRGYRIGVPRAGHWTEILNTDAAVYGGSNVGNHGGAGTDPVGAHGEAQSLSLALPPLGAIMLKFDWA